MATVLQLGFGLRLMFSQYRLPEYSQRATQLWVFDCGEILIELGYIGGVCQSRSGQLLALRRRNWSLVHPDPSDGAVPVIGIDPLDDLGFEMLKLQGKWPGDANMQRATLAVRSADEAKRDALVRQIVADDTGPVREDTCLEESALSLNLRGRATALRANGA